MNSNNYSIKSLTPLPLLLLKIGPRRDRIVEKLLPPPALAPVAPSEPAKSGPLPSVLLISPPFPPDDPALRLY